MKFASLLLSLALGDRPLLAYRQPPKLKQILTSNYRPNNRNTKAGTCPCHKPRCQLCPHTCTKDTIIGTNQASFSSKGSFTCASTNVIYAILCQKCPDTLYTGQTGRSLRKTIKEHKADIRNHNTKKSLAEHFHLCNHSIHDLLRMVTKEGCGASRFPRETAEIKLIRKLNCVEVGLNRDYGFFSHHNRVEKAKCPFMEREAGNGVKKMKGNSIVGKHSYHPIILHPNEKEITKGSASNMKPRNQVTKKSSCCFKSQCS